MWKGLTTVVRWLLIAIIPVMLAGVALFMFFRWVFNGEYPLGQIIPAASVEAQKNVTWFVSLVTGALCCLLVLVGIGGFIVWRYTQFGPDDGEDAGD